MKGRAHRPFWELFRALPTGIQQQAKKQFALWQSDPWHPSLQFKQIKTGLFSARVNEQYRALARVRGDLAVWFWIGTHAEYDKRMRR